MSDDYTPTTEEVREGYAEHVDAYGGVNLGIGFFDRWLAEHDRQVAERTLREVRNELPHPDKDARSGMIHARGLISAMIASRQ